MSEARPAVPETTAIAVAVATRMLRKRVDERNGGSLLDVGRAVPHDPDNFDNS
jgi:hypothetical protein